MPIDPARFADLLCGYCLDVQPGQQVIVRSTPLAAPLLLEVQRAVLERGGWPLLRVELPGQAAGFYAHARDAHLDGFAPVDLLEAESAELSLSIGAPENTRALSDVDPARVARAGRARTPLRTARMKGRWSLTVWPTEASAQQAGMSLDAYTAFVDHALMLDTPDPVAAWTALRERQARLIEHLSRASTIRIEAPGTDLTLSVAGRTWVNSDGKRNMPSGEVFTGPVEDSANGEITYTIPSSPRGVEVEGIRLVFKDGEVVEASADRGEDYLLETLRADPGASRLGELGIGTNTNIDRPIGQILFDEKIGGTVHLAVGNAYPETGGTNTSSVHWDMICDLRTSGRLSADGETIMENGAFAVG